MSPEYSGGFVVNYLSPSLYVVALGERRGKFIEVTEIQREIEKGIEKLLKST